MSTAPDPNVGVGPDTENGGEFEFIDSVERNLSVPLDIDTLAERGQMLAQLGVEIEELKAEKKSTVAGFSGQISEKEAERVRLQGAVAKGTEDVSVMCHQLGNWSANLIRYVRTDTGEVIEQRAMEADERQAAMFPGGADGEAQGGQQADNDGDTGGDTDNAENTDGNGGDADNDGDGLPPEPDGDGKAADAADE